MLRTVLVLCCVASTIYCRPQVDFFTNSLQRPSNTFSEPILKFLYDGLNSIVGYYFSVDTNDGFHHDAQGKLESSGKGVDENEDEGLEVTGSYSYIGTDGLKYLVYYTAGKDGFKPSGYHLVPSADVKNLGVPPISAPALASINGMGLG